MIDKTNLYITFNVTVSDNPHSWRSEESGEAEAAFTIPRDMACALDAGNVLSSLLRCALSDYLSKLVVEEEE